MRSVLGWILNFLFCLVLIFIVLPIAFVVVLGAILFASFFGIAASTVATLIAAGALVITAITNSVWW